jgi:hypothetical protein
VERQRAPVRLDDDVPALRALLAEVEVGGDVEAGIVGEGDARGDRGIAVFGVIQLRLGDEERARQDAGDDREGVDAGVEHAEAARVEDPRLARVPDANVLAPRHRHPVDPRVGQCGAGGFDAGGVARMPAGEEGDARRPRGGFEIGDLCQRRAGWLFEEDVPAGLDRLHRDGAAHLRRRAERDGVDPLPARDQIGDVVEVRHALDAFAVAADGRGERDGGLAGDGGDVLVVGDLAHADQREADRGAHSGFTVTVPAGAVARALRKGKVKGAAWISKTSPSCVWTPSAHDSVAVPKKWTWMSPGRRKAAYLK